MSVPASVSRLALGHLASYPSVTVGFFHGSKVQPVCDTDHSLQSSGEVKTVQKLYLIFPPPPPRTFTVYSRTALHY
jgi:hypothetical protein